MKASVLGMGVVLLLGSFSMGVAHAGSKPCAHVSGSAKMDCLRTEIKRGERESARLDRKVKRLDMAVKTVCTIRKFGGSVAGKAGNAMGGTAGGLAARGSWAAGNAAGDRLVGNDGSECRR
jgi:hypothetical protein